jgi:hypothetical protein
MALMKYREQNEVQWRGSRPAHHGTQVLKWVSRNNNTIVLYTVPDDQVFYLCTATLILNADVQGKGDLYVRDDAAAWWTDLIRFYHHLNTTTPNGLVTFWPPLEVPEKHTFHVTSNAVGLTVSAMIFGWVEPA